MPELSIDGERSINLSSSSRLTADNVAIAGVVASAMKRVQGQGSSSASGTSGHNNGNKANQLAAMQAMMEEIFGGSLPTLRGVLADQESQYSLIPGTSSVRAAARAMGQARKGVLVVDAEGELAGIFTPKDLLTRVVARGLDPSETLVCAVMTPNPDCVSPDLTVLDALREMHDHKFLHLPVRELDGTVVGLVDVMELICGSATTNGGKGWRDFFSGAMEAQGTNNVRKGLFPSGGHNGNSHGRSTGTGGVTGEDGDNMSDVGSVYSGIISRSMSHLGSNRSVNLEDEDSFIFKLQDHSKHTHRIKSSAGDLRALKLLVAEKISVDSSVVFDITYKDDEEDICLVKTDGCLRTAVDYARTNNLSTLRIQVDLDTDTDMHETSKGNNSNSSHSGGDGRTRSGSGLGKFVEKNEQAVIIGGSVALAAAGLMGMMLFLRKSK